MKLRNSVAHFSFLNCRQCEPSVHRVNCALHFQYAKVQESAFSLVVRAHNVAWTGLIKVDKSCDPIWS